MSFDKLKSCTRAIGLYPVARRVHRNLVDRKGLRDFRDDLAFYSQFVQPGDLCFDVGANYGAKAEVFLRLGAKVIAFEPQRDCVEELRARLGPHPRLVPINAAVGSSSGQGTLHVSKHRTASSLVQDWQGEAECGVEVPVTTLDDAIAEFGVPRFCKIDVEGWELEVFKGLSRAIPALSYEYHLKRDGTTQALACLDHLSRFGDLLVNITAAERPTFARSQWWNKSDFIDFFRREVPQMRGYGYGDIFAKVQGADGSMIGPVTR